MQKYNVDQILRLLEDRLDFEMVVLKEVQQGTPEYDQRVHWIDGIKYAIDIVKSPDSYGIADIIE